MAKPEVHAWFLGEEIADDDPLAAVKWRARDLDGAGGPGAGDAEGCRRGAGRRDDPAAALFADPAFDLEENYDVAEAVMPGADVNAASDIGLVLARLRKAAARTTAVPWSVRGS